MHMSQSNDGWNVAPAAPPLRLKLLFWFIISGLSVFFAEVVSGSYPFPFFNPFKPWDIWGWLVLMPLYGLHTLILASVIFAWGKPRFEAVFLAGAIFGLYEAYITKVLWDPTWGTPIVSVGGVAIVELVVITLWWHPFMSFAIPLAAAETTLTSSREVLDGLPGRIKGLFARRGTAIFILFAAWAGAVHGGSSPLSAFLSSQIAVIFIAGLIYLWRRNASNMSYSMRALLPDRRQAAMLMVPLALLYLIFGAFVLRQRIPGILSQAPIWALYGLFIGLLIVAIKRSAVRRREDPILGPSIGWKWVMAFAAIFTVMSVLLNGFSIIVMLISWAPGAVIGLFFLFWSARETLAGDDNLNGPEGAGNSQS